MPMLQERARRHDSWAGARSASQVRSQAPKGVQRGHRQVGRGPSALISGFQLGLELLRPVAGSLRTRSATSIFVVNDDLTITIPERLFDRTTDQARSG